MGRYALDMEKYADLARTASAEGCVLLKNDNSTLPLKKGDKVAVFGRMAFHYYKSGLGSGGLVNTRYVVGSKTIHMTKVRDGGWFRGHRKKCP